MYPNDMDIYEYTSYKHYLKDYIKMKNKHGLITQLAQAAGCDRSYFSQVMTTKAQLTPEHIFGLSTFFNFDDERLNYFLFLNTYEKLTTQRSKDLLMQKIKNIKNTNTQIEKKIKEDIKIDELSAKDKSIYYSRWEYSSVHLLTSIENYQTLQKISNKLNISSQRVASILEELIKMDLVYKNDERYLFRKKRIHIGKGSVENALNHMNWRIKASDYFNDDDSIHFTNTFTISKEDFPKLKQTVLDLIKKHGKMISESGTEDIYCFCCDLFSPR